MIRRAVRSKDRGRKSQNDQIREQDYVLFAGFLALANRVVL